MSEKGDEMEKMSDELNEKLKAIEQKAEHDVEQIRSFAQQSKDWAALYGAHLRAAEQKSDEKAFRARIESELDRLFIAIHTLVIKMGRSNPYTVRPQHVYAAITLLEMQKGDVVSKANKIKHMSLRWPIRRIVASRSFAQSRFASTSWKVLHAWIESFSRKKI